MYDIVVLVIAFICDLIWSDSQRLPHIVNLLGNLLTFFESKLYAPKKVNGFLLVIILTGLVYVVTYIVLNNINVYLKIIIGSFIAFQVLAGTTLLKIGLQIFDLLEGNQLIKAREQLRWLVGRDTNKLDEQQIKQATLESMAENLSDGMIAPLFYLIIGGVPAMLCYKMINTLDSRIGYKNDKYLNFGYAAAKLDDIANLIPARITAVLMALTARSLLAFKFIVRYASAHTSPNAGYPESALAGILNCRFGGSHIYFGNIVEKPYIGNNPRLLNYRDLQVTIKISRYVSVIFVLLGIIYLMYLN